MFFERFFVEDAHCVAENDGVRYLHHGGFDVQGKHHAGFARVFELFFVEITQRFFAHVHAVDDFASLQFGQRLEHNGFAALGDEVHLDVARFVERHRLFAVVEIAVLHVRHVGARSHAPLAHAVGVFAGVVFDSCRCAAVRVTFAQYGVDRTSQTLGIARANGFVFVGFGVFREVWKLVALALQFFDATHQLVHRGADIG